MQTNSFQQAGKLILFTSFLLASPLFAIDFINPNSSLYDDLERWNEMGYIERLPPLQPYSLQYIRAALQQIIAAAPEDEAEAAQRYLEDYIGQPIIGVEPSISAFTDFGENGSVGLRSLFNVFYEPSPFIIGAATVGVNVLTATDDFALPYGTRSEEGILDDWADFDLFGMTFFLRQNTDTMLSAGTENLWFNAGIIRSSFGPFFEDGAIVSPLAPQHGHISFVWNTDRFTYTQALLILRATDSTGAGGYPEKYVSLHSYLLAPLDWLEFGVIETVVYGGRFDLMYLLPVAELYYTQGLSGFMDNSLVAVSLGVDFPQNIRFDGLVYVDDLGFNDIVRFDFETKWKLSFELGLSWTPDLPILDRIGLEYLAIMPYMYTHESGAALLADPNYQNYTQRGESLGPSLEPNSDRLSMEVRLSPLSWLDVNVHGSFMRHGNASEGIYNGDGTIFDDGWFEGVPTFQEETRFMTQNVIEKAIVLGLRIGVQLNTPIGIWSGHLAYSFEHIWNADLVPDSQTTGNRLEIVLGWRR